MEPKLKTSHQWRNMKQFKELQLLSTKGWQDENCNFFATKITIEEFRDRLTKSGFRLQYVLNRDCPELHFTSAEVKTMNQLMKGKGYL